MQSQSTPSSASSASDDLKAALSPLLQECSLAESVEALETLRVYLSNLISFSDKSRYRSIGLENPAFQARLGKYRGSQVALEYIGFKSSGDCFIFNDDQSASAELLTSLEADKILLEDLIRDTRESLESQFLQLKKDLHSSLPIDGSEDSPPSPCHFSNVVLGLAAEKDLGPVRQTQEDSFVIVSNFAQHPSHPPSVYLGLYDGHGGRSAVDWVERSLHIHLEHQISRRRRQCYTVSSTAECPKSDEPLPSSVSKLPLEGAMEEKRSPQFQVSAEGNERDTDQIPGGMPDSEDPSTPRHGSDPVPQSPLVSRVVHGISAEAFQEAYWMTDEQLARMHLMRSGSTAVSCVLTHSVTFKESDDPSSSERLLWVANIGDSRALLGHRDSKNSTGVRVQRLTVDHKASLDSERRRVESSGGTVQMVAGMWRVNGELAVSRAFGDLALKRSGNDTCSCHAVLEYDTTTDLDSGAEEEGNDTEVPKVPEQLPQAAESEARESNWLKSGPVIATPSVTLHEIDANQSPFLVLCSDGIFDVMSDQECLDTLLEELDSLLVKSRQLEPSQRIPLAPTGEEAPAQRPSLRVLRQECLDNPLFAKSLNRMLKQAAQNLIREALSRETTDNLSVVFCLV